MVLLHPLTGTKSTCFPTQMGSPDSPSVFTTKKHTLEAMQASDTHERHCKAMVGCNKRLDKDCIRLRQYRTKLMANLGLLSSLPGVDFEHSDARQQLVDQLHSAVGFLKHLAPIRNDLFDKDG